MKEASKPMLASDNASGVHPAIFERMMAANAGHAIGYGADAWTASAERLFRLQFGEQATVFFVTTGTAANVLALQAIASSIDAVFCADCAHLYVDECGAPERIAGCKVVGVATTDGKIELPALEQAVAFHAGLVHRSRPRVVSLSQATERGTVYQPDEVRRIASFAHAHGMLVHMDGARLANAAASLGLPLAAITRDVGVDIVSFGGTKNGLMMAEAIVVIDPALGGALPPIRKQGMQLASKQRFIAAQYLGYFDDDLWLHNARHANGVAARLASKLREFGGVRVTAPVEANMVFATLPPSWIAPLQQRTAFHVWNPRVSEVRFVTSFDTSERDIDAFTGEMARLATKETV
ncbi:beta-eliminating lyase-related protein [Paraburkholderia phymatum]|uniref:threonine aldolase family protein n=1 Tax=Paraburkholderia phymatum TaxID=148447 RepID=UPI00317B8A5B